MRFWRFSWPRQVLTAAAAALVGLYYRETHPEQWRRFRSSILHQKLQPMPHERSAPLQNQLTVLQQRHPIPPQVEYFETDCGHFPSFCRGSDKVFIHWPIYPYRLEPDTLVKRLFLYTTLPEPTRSLYETSGFQPLIMVHTPSATEDDAPTVEDQRREELRKDPVANTMIKDLTIVQRRRLMERYQLLVYSPDESDTIVVRDLSHLVLDTHRELLRDCLAAFCVGLTMTLATNSAPLVLGMPLLALVATYWQAVRYKETRAYRHALDMLFPRDGQADVAAARRQWLATALSQAEMEAEYHRTLHRHAELTDWRWWRYTASGNDLADFWHSASTYRCRILRKWLEEEEKQQQSF